MPNGTVFHDGNKTMATSSEQFFNATRNIWCESRFFIFNQTPNTNILLLKSAANAFSFATIDSTSVISIGARSENRDKG